jgi:hypothetical protein
MYGAMWDEYDEGTQFLPAITKTANLPQDDGHRFTLIACDIDGYEVPPDWYMRIAGYGSSLVKSERNNVDQFPEKVIREWKPKHDVRPTRQPIPASGSGSRTSGTDTQQPSHRYVPRRVAADRELEDPPPPPYTRVAASSANVSTVVSPGPEPPVSTRPGPGLPRQESRPPPPVPPRPSSQADLLPIRHPGPGVAPAIPLASRPSPNSPPRSLHSPGPPGPPKRGPSPVVHHGEPSSSPHRLSANQPAPMDSPYPHQMPMPQLLSGTHYPMDDVGGPNSYTSPPIPMPQPEGPWYSQPNSQPGWPDEHWNNPYETAPIRHAPPPGQNPGAYGYEGGYNDSLSFPGAMPPRPQSNYNNATPQTSPFLEPQQLNPGPPPPLSPSRESPFPRHRFHVPCDYTLNNSIIWVPPIDVPQPPPHPPRPSSAQPSSTYMHRPPPPPSPYGHPAPSSPGRLGTQQGQGHHGADKPQKGTIMDRLSSVSAGSSCLAPLFSYFRRRG